MTLAQIDNEIPAYFMQANDTAAHAQLLDLFESVNMKQSSLDPERSLCMAILLDAMHCATMAGNGKIAFLRNEAIEWIKKSGGRWIFSFDSICELLGVEPRAARKAILAKPLVSQERTKKTDDWSKVRGIIYNYNRGRRRRGGNDGNGEPEEKQ